MKAGVAMSPRGVARRPVRASPSVAWIWKGNSAIAGSLRGQQKAGVAIGEEPILLPYRMSIGALHDIEPHHGTHQHEEGRFRQVEIGHEAVSHTKAVTRRDEDRGLAAERL